MANICDLSMMIRGSKANCEKFISALTQKENVFMGRGVYDETVNWFDDGGDNWRARIDGWCKWSVASALIDNAISMRTNPESWSFGDIDISLVKFVTLYDACKEYNVDCEVFSQESGVGFEEHILVVDGNTEIEDWTEYIECYPGDYKTKLDLEDAIGRRVEDYEWENKDEFISNGGYSWDFTL